MFKPIVDVFLGLIEGNSGGGVEEVEETVEEERGGVGEGGVIAFDHELIKRVKSIFMIYLLIN